MIDIPVGKALVAVPVKRNRYICDGCALLEINECTVMNCGFDLIYKLVDYPVRECSKCEESYDSYENNSIEVYDYCPSCGVRLLEPEDDTE